MPIKTVDATTLKQWLERNEAVVVDVREPAEHASEKIEGAVSLPLAQVSKQTLPEHQGKKLVVHCRSGMRSSNACQRLLAEDPSLEIYNLEGGIKAWTDAGQGVQCSGRRCLPLDRQIQIGIGVLILLATLLTAFVNLNFLWLIGFFGVGLIFAGLSGFCGLAMLLSKMPWNQIQ